MTFSKLNSEQVFATSEVWFLKQTFLLCTCTESDISVYEHINLWGNLFKPWTLLRGNRETGWSMYILNATLWLQQQTINTTWRKSRTCMPASAYPSIKVNMVLIGDVLALLFTFLWDDQFICRNAHQCGWLYIVIKVALPLTLFCQWNMFTMRHIVP